MKKHLLVIMSILAMMLFAAEANVFAQYEKNQHIYELDEGTYTFSVSARCRFADCTKLKLSVLNPQNKVLKFKTVQCREVVTTREYEDGSYDEVDRIVNCGAEITIPVTETANYTAVVETPASYSIKVVRANLPCKGFAGDWTYDQAARLTIFVHGNKATGKYLLGGYMPATFSGVITGDVLEGTYTEPDYPNTNQTRTGKIRFTLNKGQWEWERYKPDGTKNQYPYSGRCSYDVEKNPTNDELARSVNRTIMGYSEPGVPEKTKSPENKSVTKNPTSPKTNSAPVKPTGKPKANEDFDRNTSAPVKPVQSKTNKKPDNSSASSQSEDQFLPTNHPVIYKTINDLKEFLKIASTTEVLRALISSNDKTRSSVEKALNATSDDELRKMLRLTQAHIISFGMLRLYHTGKISKNDTLANKLVDNLVAQYNLSDLSSDERLNQLSARANLSLSLLEIRLDEIEEEEEELENTEENEKPEDKEKTEAAVTPQNQPSNNRQNSLPNNKQTRTPTKPEPKKESKTKKKLKGILDRVVRIN